MDTIQVASMAGITLQAGEFGDFLLRFGMNFLVVFILARVIYFSKHKVPEYLFTYFVFNILIFLICYLLANTKLKMGIAFGLFAIFSMLRYRTVVVPIKEMGYFFASVAIGIINAMTNYDDNFLIIISSNLIILVMIYILDQKKSILHFNCQIISYDKLELIKPGREQDLLNDLKERTGIEVVKTSIQRIDLVKNYVRLKLYYYSNSTNSEYTKEGDEDDDD
ncbi:MAG TPA: DUF4956 domain-containing protein [Saprospiraceae bacterium]|nr:DUF4956 domain-containing protein [Saprospiraceae bacterium]